MRTLSVIIPVRNQPEPLRRLLENLKAQQTPEGWAVEIIVAENMSTDNTLEVIRASGVRYIVCEQLGSPAARNAGARASTGNLLYFIDADACPVGDDHFRAVVSTAAKIGRPSAFGGSIMLPQRQRWNPVAIGDHWACWFNWHPKRPPQKTSLFQPGVSLIVWRRAFKAVGGFDPDILIFHDMELQRRLVNKGFPIFFAPWLRVTHEARGSPWRSWLHSWTWGGPFRTRYLPGMKYDLKYPAGHERFARNLPMLYWRRVKLVTRAAWANSKWQTVYAWPFIALTVLAWALGVIWGPDRRPASKQFPV
jgi:GT2 family glycosyltransferase